MYYVCVTYFVIMDEWHVGITLFYYNIVLKIFLHLKDCFEGTISALYKCFHFHRPTRVTAEILSRNSAIKGCFTPPSLRPSRLPSEESANFTNYPR